MLRSFTFILDVLFENVTAPNGYPIRMRVDKKEMRYWVFLANGWVVQEGTNEPIGTWE